MCYSKPLNLLQKHWEINIVIYLINWESRIELSILKIILAIIKIAKIYKYLTCVRNYTKNFTYISQAILSLIHRHYLHSHFFMKSQSLEKFSNFPMSNLNQDINQDLIDSIAFLYSNRMNHFCYPKYGKVILHILL